MELLYRTEAEYSFEEYKKFNRAIQKSGIQKFRILYLFILVVLIIISLVFLITDTIYFIFSYLFPILVFFVLMKYLFIPLLLKRNYKSLFPTNAKLYTYEFYQDFFMSMCAQNDSKFMYNSIHKIVETETNFYIMINKVQGVIIIKNNCESGLIQFLNELCLKVPTK